MMRREIKLNGTQALIPKVGLFPFVTSTLMESWTSTVTSTEKVFHNFHDVARFAAWGNGLLG